MRRGSARASVFLSSEGPHSRRSVGVGVGGLTQSTEAQRAEDGFLGGPPPPPSSQDEHLPWLFNAIDPDGSGEISSEELQVACAQISRHIRAPGGLSAFEVMRVESHITRLHRSRGGGGPGNGERERWACCSMRCGRNLGCPAPPPEIEAMTLRAMRTSKREGDLIGFAEC